MNSDMTKYCYQHFENAYNIGWNTNFDSTVESKETFNSIFIEKLTSYCENPSISVSRYTPFKSLFNGFSQ